MLPVPKLSCRVGETDMNQTLLAFTLGDVRLGLNAAYVAEVLPMMKLVTPPEMPPLLRGFAALGRELVPVIHLERLVGQPVPEVQNVSLQDRIIVARISGGRLAWCSGPDMEPLPYRSREVNPLPPDHVLNNCAVGVLPGQPPITMLEPDRLLLEAERLRLEELRAKASARQSWLDSVAAESSAAVSAA